jgi:hypothetical protein
MNLVNTILEKRHHNKFRTICAHIKNVKTMNLNGSVKQEDQPTAHPPYSPDLACSYFHLLRPLKDPLGHYSVYNDELKHSVHEELQRFSKEVCLHDQYTASQAKLEKVCS